MTHVLMPTFKNLDLFSSHLKTFKDFKNQEDLAIVFLKLTVIT